MSKKTFPENGDRSFEPVAVVGQSVATAALPALTQLWAEGKANEVNRALSTTLRATLAMGLTMAAGFFVLANPIVTVLYERGVDQFPRAHADTRVRGLPG